MKNLLLSVSFALLSLVSFANNNPGEEDDKGNKTEEAISQKHVKLYQGLYLSMEDVDVHKYIKEDLKGEKDEQGIYKVIFFEQEAFMHPIFSEGKLERVEISFRSEYADDVLSNLKNLESTLNSMEGWTLNKASDEQWLFEKNLNKTVDNMNQITIYTYGVHQDEVGTGWHTQVQISPRFEGQPLSEEEINERGEELASFLD